MKYFALAVLFLVVAGVIAYDRWNAGTGDPLADARGADDGRIQADVSPGAEDPESLTVPPRDEQPPTMPPAAEPEVETPPLAEDPGSIALPPIRPIEREDITLPPAPREDPPAKKEVEPKRTAPKKAEPKLVTPKAKPAARPIKTTDTIHTVRSGENLEKIALRYYGTRRGIAWIVEANNLRDANRIYERQSLLIPARDDSLIRRTAKLNTKRSAPERKVPRTHTVTKSDGDLYAICRKYYGRRGEGARVARIMQLNKLWSADVKVGTVLILPAK
ncbi:MAG: LysM peptidoglycan-binding domain-containing protein [Planctomycetota bacterium]